MMAECIDRKAAIDVVTKWFDKIHQNGDICIDGLRSLPAADVMERKTGVWIGEGDGYADGVMVYDTWFCGCCGTQIEGWEEKPKWKYCPVCGSYNGGE